MKLPPAPLLNSSVNTSSSNWTLENPTVEDFAPTDTGSLLDKARDGDAVAYGEVYRAHATRLIRHAMALCGNRALAEELAQDTLLEAWRSLSRYRGRCQFFTWEELSNVAGQLALAALVSNLEASERFHRRMAERPAGLQSRSFREHLATWLHEAMRSWRVALPTIAALLIAGLLWVASPSHPAAALPAAPTFRVGDHINSERGMAPTLANYQTIAGQSLGEVGCAADPTRKPAPAAGSPLHGIGL